MAFQLVAEVLDHGPNMTPAERLLLVAIAEKTRHRGQVIGMSAEDLTRRICLDASNIRAALRRLAEREIHVRVPLGSDREGRPVYAYRGQVPRYLLPSFPPPAGCPCDTCHAQAGPEGVAQRPPSEPEGVGERPPSVSEGVAQRPPSDTEGGRRNTEGGRRNTEGGRRTTESVAQRPPLPSIDRTSVRVSEPLKPLPGSLIEQELSRRAGVARTGSNGGQVRTHPFVAGESYRDYRGDEIADCATCGMPQRHRAHARST